MRTRLNDFAFRGLLAGHAIADLRASGLLRSPAVTADERREQDLFAPLSDEIREGSIQMQRCYRVLFAFENFVREFISSRFEEIDGGGWFDRRAAAAMKRKVDERKQAEVRNQWHSGRNEHQIFHLDFGDLALLIINHWDCFKDFFPSQSWVTSRLQDAERTRNVIAHTNILASEEAHRMEMYLRDWIKQIG